MPHTKSCPKSYAKTYPNAPQNLSAKSHLYSFFTLTTLFMLNNAFGDEKSSIISPPPPIDFSQNHSVDSTQNDKIQEKMLERVVATGYKEQDFASQAGSVDRKLLDSLPAGNGDIISALKVLPNVVSNNPSNTSNKAGEVNPANVSISGGLPYQNSFLLDGFEMSNEIDPAGSSANSNSRLRGSQSQGLNVDTSLLDSITVLDSNVSAAYGRFSGGVVEANIRKPRLDKGITNGWHANISYQHTQGGMTKVYDLPADSIISTNGGQSNENYQKDFYKHIVRASLEGWITKNLGLIASYSTARSYIGTTNTYGENSPQQVDEKTPQYRISDNYYAKLFYNPLENLTLEYSFAYMPQNNRYFMPNYKNSGYTMKGGGIQTGAKALWQTPMGLWSNTLSYSRLENSRNSDVNYYTRLTSQYEGQVGSVNQTQNNITLKSDFSFDTLRAGIFSQIVRVGGEFIWQDATRNRPENSLMYVYPPGVNNGLPDNLKDANNNRNDVWNGLPDSFGVISATATTGYYTMGMIKAGKTAFSTLTYALYAEDSASLDIGRDRQGGELKARFGLRLDGDDYMKKHKIAPRFSLSYITPAPKDYQSTFTFGVNRYYSRNLLTYRFYADTVNNRVALWRCSINDAWKELVGPASSINCNNGINYTAGNFSNGTVGAGRTKLQDLEVPYDDELMGSITQNLGSFSATIKYIRRDGKNQIIQKAIDANTADYEFSNDGRSKSDIVSFILQNSIPLDTWGIKHFYLFALDWNNTSRNFNTHSADYNLKDMVVWNGTLTTYGNMPAQKYNQPLTLKLNTTHTFNLWRTKWLWNNFFSWRGKYERVVLSKLGQDINSLPAPSCNATNNRNVCNEYSTATLGNIFNWDMRLGFEIDLYKGQTLYANFDIYNVLGSKNLVTLSGEDGVLLYGVPSNAYVLGYSLGRQFWAQVGYKF